MNNICESSQILFLDSRSIYVVLVSHINRGASVYVNNCTPRQLSSKVELSPKHPMLKYRNPPPCGNVRRADSERSLLVHRRTAAHPVSIRSMTIASSRITNYCHRTTSKTQRTATVPSNI